jgi:hypothetical protein
MRSFAVLATKVHHEFTMTWQLPVNVDQMTTLLAGIKHMRSAQSDHLNHTMA